MNADLRDQQKQLQSRVKRIKGQLEGIEKMLGQRNCLEVVQQISSVRAALAKIAGIILAEESCNKRQKNPEEFKRIINELVKNI